jgi:dTDP-4-amino-4,6-dideoxygalactose transaminase
MDAIGRLTERNGIAIVEDVAQAHGARHRGRYVGTIGAAGCFSFYPTKNLGACGDAGMVVTNEAALAQRLRRLRNYGEQSKYNNASFGVNSRLDEMQAAILRVKLPLLDTWNAARRARAAAYRARLREAPLRLPQEADWAEHVYHLFVVRHRRRDALRAALRDFDIGTSIHYPTPIHFQEAWRTLGKGPGSFPVAEQVCAECLSLPLSPGLSEADIDTVSSAILEHIPQAVEKR